MVDGNLSGDHCVRLVSKENETAIAHAMDRSLQARARLFACKEVAAYVQVVAVGIDPTYPVIALLLVGLPGVGIFQHPVPLVLLGFGGFDFC